MRTWCLPAKMVELVLKKKMIFDAFAPESGKGKIALKVRFAMM